MARHKSSMSDYSNMSIFKIFKKKLSERTPTEKLIPTEIYSKKNEKCKNTKLMINITDNKEPQKKRDKGYRD